MSYLTRNNVKVVSQIAIALCVSKVVNDVVTNNTNQSTSLDQGRVFVGGAIVGYVVADACETSVNRLIDTTFDLFEKK